MARNFDAHTNTAPKLIALVLLALLILIQYPLWYGKGSEKNIHELKVQRAVLQQNKEKLQHELGQLEAEADSLRAGSDAIDARARSSMNMIKENEVLFRWTDKQ